MEQAPQTTMPEALPEQDVQLVQPEVAVDVSAENLDSDPIQSETKGTLVQLRDGSMVSEAKYKEMLASGELNPKN